MSYVEYNSSNSGGNWWLDDDDWKALEAAGWEVDWCAKKTGGLGGADEHGRWLGALATSAKRPGLTLREAVDEFERVTKATSTDAGCPCCGQPHSFTEYTDDGKYVASGPDASYSCEWN